MVIYSREPQIEICWDRAYPLGRVDGMIFVRLDPSCVRENEIRPMRNWRLFGGFECLLWTLTLLPVLISLTLCFLRWHGEGLLIALPSSSSVLRATPGMIVAQASGQISA